MRGTIVHPGADELTYEIRNIVGVGERLAQLGVPIYWENIGDPVAKGVVVPEWVKEIVSDLTKNDNSSYGYSPTRGVLATREYLAACRNREGGVEITPHDILFFNGLGDAIQTSYLYLHPRARVLGPNPAYPTHSSAEAAHADAPHLTYRLDPENNWQPDLEDMRNKVRYNPQVSGILIINPDNPTGTVYTQETLTAIVDLAAEYGLFIMSDEIYSNIVYEGEMVPLSRVLGDVPGMALKGLSKEVPWPGARCGWIEFYNTDKDEQFARYVKTLVDAKMLEVCSTTLPQKALPRIFEDPRHHEHLKEMATGYRERAELFVKAFAGFDEVIANKPHGAFYASVVFRRGVLGNKETLPIRDETVAKYIQALVKDVAPDRRFVYYLMASTGITVVPLSTMNSDLFGIRLTLLEPNLAVFTRTLETIVAAMKSYIRTTP